MGGEIKLYTSVNYFLKLFQIIYNAFRFEVILVPQSIDTVASEFDPHGNAYICGLAQD